VNRKRGTHFKNRCFGVRLMESRKVLVGGKQRVLNDLQRTRLSCGRMNWLLAHPLPSASCLSFSLFLCAAAVKLERGEGGAWARNHESYDRKKVWSSIKSFNTYSLAESLHDNVGLMLQIATVFATIGAVHRLGGSIV
jgi:hypothetical protein